MHSTFEMSAFSPVMKCPGDETSSPHLPVVAAAATAAPAEDDGMPISVAVRFRPDLGDKNGSRCVHPLQSSPAQASGHLTDLTFVADSTSQRFHFDHIFPENCDQKKVFEDSVSPLIPLLFDGYNLCVLVYGQSGAGKTFTLAGPPTEEHLTTREEEFGIILRSVRAIFQTIHSEQNLLQQTQVFSDEEELSEDMIEPPAKDIVVRASFIDVDNDDVHDLLSDVEGVALVEKRLAHGANGPKIVLEGVTEMECAAVSDVWVCYENGSAIHRLRQSSQVQPRSHTVFTVSLTIFESNSQIYKTSSIRFVEIVASDYMLGTVPKSAAIIPPARHETAQATGLLPHLSQQLGFQSPSVDLGLLSLRSVVTALADPRRKARIISYGDSLLTQILVDVFGGSCVSLILCCVNTDQASSDETLNTLKFGNWCSKITNRPSPNVKVKRAEQYDDDNEDDEEAELVGANFRRDSDLSELQQRLRSVSATDGRLFYSGGQMPDVVNNSSFGPTSQQHPMLNNNPRWVDPQLQLQIYQQQLLIQQQMQSQLMPMIPNNVGQSHYQDLILQTQLLQQQQQQQQLQQQLLSPTNILAANNLRNNFPMSPPDPTLLNHLYQQQLQQQIILHQQLAQQQQLSQHQLNQQQQQQLLRDQLESPFVPITHRSPHPENVSPLSQQKSPLNVALYLPVVPSSAENFSAEILATSRPEKIIPPSSVTLPLNLPSQDIDESASAATSTPRKSDTRRSSLAANKLTRIVEESEHEASTNSSKEISARHTEQDHSSEDDDDDDFDSECSVVSEVSDLDTKTDQLVEKFRSQTRTLIADIELTFFDFAAQPLGEIVADMQELTLKDDSRPERQATDLKKMALECEIKKLSSIQESKETSVAETEQILFQVQLELAEVKKSIMVKDDLLHELSRTESEMRRAGKSFQKHLRSLHTDFAEARKQLRHAQRSLYLVKDSEQESSTQKRVESLKLNLAELQKKIDRTEEAARLLIVQDKEGAAAVEADLQRMRQIQTELEMRLEEEQARKLQLQQELERDRAAIEQLERQLLEQSEQIRLSLQLSQEFELRKDRLAVEESRLELALNETRALHQSLIDQQAELEARENALARSLTTISRNESKIRESDEQTSPSLKDESKLKMEIQQLRDFNLELIGKRQFLLHSLQHSSFERTCPHCMNDYQQGLEPAAVRLGGTPRADDQRRYIELDVFVDAIDAAIEYKQDILGKKAIDYDTNSDYPDNFLMRQLCLLSVGEVRALLHKFVERTIDLRHEGSKADVEIYRLTEEVNRWARLGRDLDHQLSIIHSGYQRKMDVQKREHAHKLALMARSSKAAISTDGNGNETALIEKLKFDLSRYKDRCRAYLAELEALRKPEVGLHERRKSSDGGGSDTSARLQRFHRLAQTVKTAEADKSSKVTRHGKKLIIEQPQQQQISGNSFDLGKLKQKKK